MHVADRRPAAAAGATSRAGIAWIVTALSAASTATAVFAATPSAAADGAPAPLSVFEQDGVRLRVWLDSEPEAARARSGTLPAAQGTALQQAGRARLKVAVHSTLDDAPLSGVQPGAWLDPHDGEPPAESACSQRIGSYVARRFTQRAWRDLTGYHVLLLNGDASLSVLDPQTNFAGRTSLRTVVPLPAPGFDWDLDPAGNRAYVSVPQTRQLAIVDLQAFGEPALVQVPGSPGRVKVHATARQVWVGVPSAAPRATNTGVQPAEGGVFVVSIDDPTRRGWITTGNGHHEFAFDPDGLVAVTNRDSGSVSFIDPVSLLERRRAPVPGTPLSVVFDKRERLFVVAEARDGALLRFDHTGSQLERLQLRPGVGPMGFSPDGRWLLVLNPAANLVHVVDAGAWQRVHDVPLSGRPFQLEFTTQYAYVRSLDRAEVSMIHLPSLVGDGPRVQQFSAGEKRAADVADLPIASQVAPLPDDTGVFALSPADGAVYTYMQGMNAPMSSAAPRGHPLRAVRVAPQGLVETGRGQFEARVDLPRHPAVLIAVATDRPRLRHCLRVDLAPPLEAAEAAIATRLTWRVAPHQGPSARIELALQGDPRRVWPDQLTLWLHRPGSGRLRVPARRTGTEPAGDDGARVVYEAAPAGLPAGAHYVHLQSTGDDLVPPVLARRYTSFIVRGDGQP